MPICTRCNRNVLQIHLPHRICGQCLHVSGGDLAFFINQGATHTGRVFRAREPGTAPVSTKRCWKCGREIQVVLSLCPTCETPVETPEHIWFCTSCDEQLRALMHHWKQNRVNPARVEEFEEQLESARRQIREMSGNVANLTLVNVELRQDNEELRDENATLVERIDRGIYEEMGKKKRKKSKHKGKGRFSIVADAIRREEPQRVKEGQ